jgi:HTH-type transcriptional regulator/antitoxin HigA
VDIRPIKTDEDYRAVLEEIDRLFDAAPDTPEGDRLEVLVALVEAYEREHYPAFLPDPVEAIEYYMESRGLSRQDLEPYIGSRARVSEILNRRRPLTLRMIRNLEAELGIPAEILVQPYDLQPYDCADVEEEKVLHEQGVQVTPRIGRYASGWVRGRSIQRSSISDAHSHVRAEDQPE